VLHRRSPYVWADSGYPHEENERAQEASKFGIPSTALGELLLISLKPQGRMDGQMRLPTYRLRNVFIERRLKPINLLSSGSA
jgi:hypothetical protein